MYRQIMQGVLSTEQRAVHLSTPVPGQPGWLLVGLGLATGMEFFTFDAMNLVLVDLAGALGVSLDQASWLLTVYSSTMFLGVPVCIWLADSVSAYARRHGSEHVPAGTAQDNLELVTARFDSGLTGALDAARARADLADSEADIPAIETAERAAIYRLGALTGRPPETLLSMLIPPPIPSSPS